MRIVTGMHRSGTSFVANILHSLGMSLGSETAIIPTDCWNSAGYYENFELVVLNDRLILGDWFGLEKFRQIPSGSRPFWLVSWLSLLKLRYVFLRSTTGIACRADLCQAEMKRFAQNNRGLLLKDPRFSLTIHVWRKYAGISDVLYSFRHPLEVAQSLRKREKIPLWLGLQIWLFHVESFLQQTEGLPVIYVNFNNFFDDESCMEEIRRCFSFARLKYCKHEANILLRNCLRKDLKKNLFSGGEPIPERCSQMYHRLLALHGSLG